MPEIRQVFVGGRKGQDQEALERKLYVIRKRVEQLVRTSGMPDSERFYVPSLSSRTVVYKGLLLPDQIPAFYHDLADPLFVSALALVHQRFSTNTFPSWDRAHPYRFIGHNGEINTLRGNVNWMFARQAMFASPLFDDVTKLFPIIDPLTSDSGNFDNALELLVRTGRSLPHAIMMMIPEAWQNHEGMSPAKRAFYEYHACLQEPWDGPASIAFTDGRVIGAVLDRNGLRPSRYVVTKDGFVVMASEVGVLDIAPDNVEHKDRLQPGRMFLVDTEQGRIVGDEEIKESMAARKPYRAWLDTNLRRLAELPPPAELPPAHAPDTLLARQQAFGYTIEDLRLLMTPMALNGQEAVGSMGTDTPLAVLSERPQLLFNYFKQLFAQVTNPPIDPIREELVMSVETTIGPEQQPVRRDPAALRPAAREEPDAVERGARAAEVARRRQPAHADAVHGVSRRLRRRGAAQRPRGAVRAGVGRRGPGRDHPRAVRSRRRSGSRADPEPARHRRGPPSPHPRGHAHALWPGGGVGRATRGAAFLPAGGVRRGRRESLSGLRDAA